MLALEPERDPSEGGLPAIGRLLAPIAASRKPMNHEDAGETRELYSNHFRIGFNVAEFLVDFGRNFDGDERFYQRIITAPVHARELSRLLGEALQSYESKFGLITGDSEVKE